jgi:hypothetical protein
MQGFTTSHPFNYMESSVPGIVARLLAPLDEASAKKQVSATISLQWAMRIIGEKSFKILLGKTRKVLRDNSSLYQYGKKAGLPVKIFSWLAGDPATETLRILINIPDTNNVRTPPVFYPHQPLPPSSSTPKSYISFAFSSAQLKKPSIYERQPLPSHSSRRL